MKLKPEERAKLISQWIEGQIRQAEGEAISDFMKIMFGNSKKCTTNHNPGSAYQPARLPGPWGKGGK